MSYVHFPPSPEGECIFPFSRALCLSPPKAYKVLGHMDILGDPLSLGENMASGVFGFVTKVSCLS